jgi:hypothetical protein
MRLLASITILLAVVAKQCVSFDPVALDDKHQIAVPEEAEKGTKACQYQKGYIDDFSGEIYSWWVGNDKLQLTRQGDTLKIVAKEVGSQWTPFGKEMALLDFTECPVVKVRCRAEGDKSPTISVHLKDVNALDANADAPKARIHLGKDFKDYYFSFNNKWKQTWPDIQKVDETMIREIMVFINGGMVDWTGTLYVDEIKVVPMSEVPVVIAQAGGYIDDFSDELYSWWAGNEKVNLEKLGDQMVVACNGAGPTYELFGRAFDEMDFNKAQIVRIKARSEGGSPLLRVDFKDKNGYVTNGSPVINKIQESSDFKDYFYNYRGKYTQSWPEAQTVDPSGIKEVLMFINPGGEAFTGKIFIEEIEVITDDQYAKLTGGVTEGLKANAAGLLVVDDFSGDVSSWWSGSDKITFSKDASNALLVNVAGAGPKFDVFGTSFKTVDFTKTPIVKLRIKNTGAPLDLRVDVKDMDGNTTNATPNIAKVTTSADYVTYYLDFSGKFNQVWPSTKTVNPAKISEMILMPNPGGTAYNGSFLIDEINLLTIEQYNSKK